MKIAILTLGTRGDVQPYAILGKALIQRGHQVTLSTAKNFEPLISSYGIPFVPVEADFQQLLTSEEGKAIRKNPFRAKKMLNRVVYPLMQDALSKFFELANSSDKVLFHVKTMADTFADQFPNKMIEADVVPAVQPTRYFPNPVFAALPVPSFLNRLTFTVTALGLRMWMKPVMAFRRQTGLNEKFQKPALPCIYGISEHLLQRPVDYPSNSYFTGFWSEESGGSLPSRIKEFLDAGEPPLVITFGSMAFETKLDIMELIAEITRALGLRVILIKGWGTFDDSRIRDNPKVLVIESVPHDLLFPKVKAVVHHGGIGTVAACLRAGKPFLACPVLYPLGDQFFWGKIGADRGVSLTPIPLKKASLPSMIKAIGELVNNTTLHRNAEQMALQLTSEDGVGKAIQIIEASVGANNESN